jgi:hypothetical protein
MTISLSYDVRYSVFKSGSNVTLNADFSTLERIIRVYVLMMIFISYSMYSHDFSYISSNIIFCTFDSCGRMVRRELRLEYFPNRKR